MTAPVWEALPLASAKDADETSCLGILGVPVFLPLLIRDGDHDLHVKFKALG